MKFFLLILFTGAVVLCNGQDVMMVMTEAQKMEDAMQDVEALATYKRALSMDSMNVILLCKCSELSSRIGARIKDDETIQQQYYKAAREYARQALRLNPSLSEANFVMALVMGNQAMTASGGKEKIAAVKALKKYADLAIRFDPQNYKAWFVLGKWYYEISDLNYFELTAVKVFFGALPPASFDDAVRCFERVKSLNSQFVLNYLALAKAYKKKDELSLARQNIHVMLNLQNQTEDDEGIKKEGRDLLKKWD